MDTISEILDAQLDSDWKQHIIIENDIFGIQWRSYYLRENHHEGINKNNFPF